MTVCYLGIGSNVGDRAAFCRAAVTLLSEAPGVEVEAVSSLYETSPLGGPPQRSYINLVVRLRTGLDPRELLGLCKSIERRLGREPSEIRWGPRVVDLDILTYAEEKLNEPDLEIPHPRLVERRFALVPLLELEPEATDPWGRRYADWLDEAGGEVEPLQPF